MKTLYIRPVYTLHPDQRETLTGLALCSTNGELLVDGQIIEHFPKDESGKDIKACAKEFHGADNTEWGKPISNKSQ